jgi:hypothetical protein
MAGYCAFCQWSAVAVIELKNAAGGTATIWSAFQQLQTYQVMFADRAALHREFVRQRICYKASVPT